MNVKKLIWQTFLLTTALTFISSPTFAMERDSERTGRTTRTQQFHDQLLRMADISNRNNAGAGYSRLSQPHATCLQSHFPVAANPTINADINEFIDLLNLLKKIR